MSMESFYEQHSNDKGHSTGPHPSSLPRRRESHQPHQQPQQLPYPPDFQVSAEELYSSCLVETTAAPELYIPSTLDQYPIRTLHPVDSTSLAYPPYTHPFNPPQWGVGAVADNSGLSNQYQNAYTEVILPSESNYFQPAVFHDGSSSNHSLSPYEGSSNGILHDIPNHSADFSHTYIAATLGHQVDSLTASDVDPTLSYPGYPELNQQPQPAKFIESPVRIQEELLKVSNSKKPRKRLDQVSLKQTNGQITKQKRIPIVKGDRGKQSRAESCWRCRRYKKPCHKATGDCSSCITSGFRIWPSALGCRRGQMTDFALLIIPSNFESLVVPKTVYVKPMSWRKPTAVFDNQFRHQSVVRHDKWDELMTKIRSIKILGPGIPELIQIAADCERRREKSSILLTLSARCLTMAIDLWQIYVATTVEEYFNLKLDVKAIFVNLRQLLLSAVQRFLTTCLTGRVKDWLSTFLAVNILGLVYILLGDTIIAIPNKDSVWPDIKKTILDLRTFHPVCRDLLYVLAKGCDLLGMDWVDSQEALRLVDDDQTICDGMRELQLWRNNLIQFLEDDRWMELAPFQIDLLPVTSLSRLFLPQKKGDQIKIKAV